MSERDPYTDPRLKPPTDEFGRSDPDVLEREQRRKEREARRTGEHELPPSAASGRRRRKPKAEREKPARSMPKLSVGRGRRKADPDPGPGPGPDLDPGLPPETPAPPPGKPPKPPRRTRGGGGSANFGRRRIFALVAALAGILAIWFLVAFFQPFGGEGEGTISVTIPQGADASGIAEILDENGVVSSGRLFEWRLRLSGKSGDIQAGDYVLAEGMSYGKAIDRLTGEAGELASITIPEGFNRRQIAEKLAATGIEGDYLQASLASPGFDPAAYGAKNPPAKGVEASLEGFLYPATYEMPDGATATDLVAQQVAAFQNQIATVDLAYAKKKNLNVYDVLKIASMVELETAVPKERPLVAAVIYNRLSMGQILGIDATTVFETGTNGAEITQAQLDADTPFNTRVNTGLTPTPIGNPGIDSIKAAANPARVGFLFYVATPDGCGHTFTNTEAEHNAAAAKYAAAVEANGGAPPSC
jgi:uncharacterized YceG family protein